MHFWSYVAVIPLTLGTIWMIRAFTQTNTRLERMLAWLEEEERWEAEIRQQEARQEEEVW